MIGPEYRGRDRFPARQERGICRGCRGLITDKRRQTWCSQECQEKFHPFYVKQAVRERDGNKCQQCGKDCSRQAGWDYSKLLPQPPNYTDCGLQYPYDPQAHYISPLYLQYVAALKEWKRNSPRAEFDHIVPHSEGGLFVLENIRLLCRACHLERTRQWRKERKKNPGVNRG